MKRSVLLVLLIMFAVAPIVAQPTVAGRQYERYVHRCRHKQQLWDFRWHLRHLF